METGKIEKATALMIAVGTLILAVSHPPFSEVGIYAGGPFEGRFAYHFYHANIVHAALNVWCFLTLVFVYDIRIWRIVAALAAASSVPSALLGDSPTVGLSGIVFFLFGSLSFEVVRKRYYQSWMLFYLVVGFFIPGTNAMLHLYCYAVGFILALINKPIKISE